MGNIKFTNNSVKVKGAIKDACIAALYAAGGELQSEVVKNQKRYNDTGQTAGSWTYRVDEGNMTATVGSTMENAIWEEFGTGQYALNGDGRKGGWFIPGDKLSAKAKSKMQKIVINGKEYYLTYGKKPRRHLFRAMNAKKAQIRKAFEEKMKGLR